MTTPTLSILWTARSGNRKTGNVPTAWVGATREESKQSCAGCPLLGNGCYAQTGTVALGHSSAIKGATRRPARYTLTDALQRASKGARMVRLSAIGDMGRTLSGAVLATLAEVAPRLDVVGYTHHWKEKEVTREWRGTLLASTETPADADRALSEGWRASLVTGPDAPRSWVTPAGNRVVQCPATLPGVKITCNQCRLCAGSKPGPIVAFPVHGGSKRAALKVTRASFLTDVSES